MQIPILNGVYATRGPDLRISYPVNLVPVPKQTGVSAGFLRPADGLVQFGEGPGTDRGGINWNGVCYRVMGTKLVKVESDGEIVILGDVGGPVDTFVTMDYSFDYLAIASGGRLYYWSSAHDVQRVTDADLGEVLDVAWIDGYFMTTDGTSLVVTELNDPFAVNPLKYGSSEVDPDPVVALLKLRNEIFALNRNTIEVFDNVGGDFFPFQRIEGAQIQKGVIGTHGCCVFVDSIAFLGSGRNEEPGIYLGVNANAIKISTQEVDEILLGYSESVLAGVKLEARNDKDHKHLYIHLPDRTLVYDAAASTVLKAPVWFTLTSSTYDFSQYRARNFVWCYDKWIFGDTQSHNVGYTDSSIGTHWGNIVRWEFGTLMLYNESKGAIVNELELVALTGNVALGMNPIITTSYSLDGRSWSQNSPLYIGTTGATNKRLAWFQQGSLRSWRVQRFRGDSQARLSFARLEATVEPLAY